MANDNEIFYGENEETILPEGWSEGVDIFSLEADEDSTEGNPTTDNPEESEGETSTEGAEGTTEPEDKPNEPEDAPPDEPVKSKLKVKHNHQELEIDEDEAVPLVQKGLDYDRVKKQVETAKPVLERAERMAKNLGYESTQAMLDATEEASFKERVDALVEDGVHPAIAEDHVRAEEQRKKEDFERAQRGETQAKMDKEAELFVQLYPGVTEIPSEVWEMTREGLPLTTAYERFKSSEMQKEFEILKQNQSSAERAPVRSATKHGSSEEERTVDPFVQGFDSDSDW